MRYRLPRGSYQPRVLLQRAGYNEFRDSRTGAVSYMRRLTGQFYPRFHVYIEEKGDDVILNIHLDQKRPSYAGSHMHSGEYDGPLIETEGQRIGTFFPAIS